MDSSYTKYINDMWYLPKATLLRIFVLTGLGLFFAIKNPFHTMAVDDTLFFLPVFFLISSAKLVAIFTAILLGTGTCIYLYSADWLYMVGLLSAIIFTVPLTSLLHITSHGCIRPRWLNRLLGEFSAISQLSSFTDWMVMHALHHIHVDDPKLDPHPPDGKTYWTYIRNMKANAVNVYVKAFQRKHGSKKNFELCLKVFILLSKIQTYVFILFWYFLLGPKLFISGLVFSIAVKTLHYAWFNWRTHKALENGNVEILNLDGGIYTIFNLLSYNMYYHGNHHNQMYTANPKKIINRALHKKAS
tara:strand:- start:3821 stop:4726 length:906 start_codon:yes stop_codon:yes gene_type:complete